MKIAFVTPEYVTEEANFDGGLANYLHRASLALLDMGHEPHIFVSSDHDEDMEHRGVQVHRVAIDQSHNRARWRELIARVPFTWSRHWLNVSFGLNQALEKFHQKEKFDLVQYASYGGMAYYRVKEIPAVVRISSFEPLYREGRGDPEPGKDQSFVEKIEVEAMKKVDAVFGPSNHTNAAVAEAIGNKVATIETPFLLDTSHIDNSIYRTKLEGKKYLLFFGTLWRIKGSDTIAGMINRFLKEYPDHNLVMVGKDFGGVEPITEAAGEYKDRVIYLGKMPHSQLYPIIEHASCVLLPSLQDNFPNTCIEAMAHRRIVIGTLGTSFEQIITDGVNGFLSEAGNSDDLLRKTKQALALDPQQLAQIQKQAYARIEKLKPEIVVLQLVKFYQDVIAKFTATK